MKHEYDCKETRLIKMPFNVDSVLLVAACRSGRTARSGSMCSCINYSSYHQLSLTSVAVRFHSFDPLGTYIPY